MSNLLWSLALISTGVGGMWLAGSKRRNVRHSGWVLYSVNEVLWFAYGITLQAPPLFIMAVVWFAVGVRNVLNTRKES